MKAGKTHGYVLTFRCVNCGRHEVFGDYATDKVEPEDRIRGRIYEVTCYSCGWSGEACGQSAIRISRTDLRPRGARWQSSGS